MKKLSAFLAFLILCLLVHTLPTFDEHTASADNTIIEGAEALEMCFPPRQSQKKLYCYAVIVFVRDPSMPSGQRAFYYWYGSHDLQKLLNDRKRRQEAGLSVSKVIQVQ